MSAKTKAGTLVIIGGGEDRKEKCLVLKAFLDLAGGPSAKLVVVTAATDYPEEVGQEYIAAFEGLGAKSVQVVDVSMRGHASDPVRVEAIAHADGLLFTGGDQLHITSLIGGSPLYQRLKQRYQEGVVLAGTSAGAAMMSNGMILSGEGESCPRLGCIEMAPGMDFLPDTIIDTHFSQRGRMGRLLSAVAHFPQNLGLGIDEDTAIVVEGSQFRVIGSGSVTVVDATTMTYTNVPEAGDDDPLTLFGLQVHLLSSGFAFDLQARAPVQPDKPVVKAQTEEK